MCEYSSFIISGPELNDSEIPEESIGKYIIDSLSKVDKNKVIFVDPLTNETQTCGELRTAVLKCAAVFHDLGLKENDVLTIVAEKSINYLVPVIAALYNGIIVNPLNPGYTSGELEHCLSLTKPKLILCSSSSLKAVFQSRKIFQEEIQVILLESDVINGYSLSNLNSLIHTKPEITTNDMAAIKFNCINQGAFIMLSSGTTGLPKGVLLTHQNIRVALISTAGPDFGKYLSSDVILHVLPYFHVYGLMVSVIGITKTLKTVIIRKFKPELFLKSIQDHKITKLPTVPTLLLFIVKSPIAQTYDLSSMRDVLIGAAAVSEELLKKSETVLCNAKIRQLYGLTEIAGAATYQHPHCTRLDGVGKLVPGMQAKIWNSESNKVVGVYQKGELCFKGGQVMKEYVSNQTATEESIDEDGFYHTGDLAYYDEDGNIFIEARIKELIKYKGFQVSPTEIEGLLLTNDKIKDCGVVGMPDERCGQLPLAFVVKQTNCSDLSEQEVIAFIAENLSFEKRLHGGVKFVDAIPKNANGKIIRAELMKLLKS